MRLMPFDYTRMPFNELVDATNVVPTISEFTLVT